MGGGVERVRERKTAVEGLSRDELPADLGDDEAPSRERPTLERGQPFEGLVVVHGAEPERNGHVRARRSILSPLPQVCQSGIPLELSCALYQEHLPKRWMIHDLLLRFAVTRVTMIPVT